MIEWEEYGYLEVLCDKGYKDDCIILGMIW